MKTFIVTVDGVEHTVKSKNVWAAIKVKILEFPKAKKVTAILKGALK